MTNSKILALLDAGVVPQGTGFCPENVEGVFRGGDRFVIMLLIHYFC